MNTTTLHKIALAGLCASSVFSLVGCGKTAATPTVTKQPAGDTAWTFSKTIPEPVTDTGGGAKDVKLGNLAVNNVVVDIPKGALDADVAISLANPDDAPKYVGAEMEPVAAPIEIKTGNKPVRLNEKATVTFKFDKTALPPNTEPFDLRVVYYDGATWEFLRPTTLDLDKGTATFETWHFSLFGLNKIKDKTKLTEDWIHSKTLDKELKKNFNKMSDHVTNQIIDMTLQKMGVSDKTVKGQVLADVLKDDGYKEIYDAFEKGDVTGANQKIALLAGKKLASRVPASVYQGALKNIVGGAKDIEAATKAAANIAEGRYEDAARIIGEQIADKFIITTAGKIAVEVMQGQIDSWKNSEVEAAYKAYRNGSNGYFWGYNNDAKDFDATWDQMRGIRRQLEIDAIKKENAVRRESGMPALTEAQQDMVREGVKESFRRQFAKRAEGDDRLQKEEEKMRTIVAAFAGAGFFDTAGAPAGLERGLDYENKLEVLYHFADKVMADTKRFDLTDKTGLIADKAINPDDIVQAARYWFSGPDGRKQYAKFIKDRFGISLSPDLANLAGAWQNGKLTITDVYVSDALKQAAAAQQSDKSKSSGLEGCDFAITPEMLMALKGKEAPMSFSITPNGDNAGTLVFQPKDSEAKSVPFTYDGGTIKATMSEKGANATFTIDVSESAKNYDANGTLVVEYGGGQFKITAKITATHALPAAKPSSKK